MCEDQEKNLWPVELIKENSVTREKMCQVRKEVSTMITARCMDIVLKGVESIGILQITSQTLGKELGPTRLMQLKWAHNIIENSLNQNSLKNNIIN